MGRVRVRVWLYPPHTHTHTHFYHTRPIPIFFRILIPIPAKNGAGSGRVFRVRVRLPSLHKMPQIGMLHVEFFDMLGINSIGPFPHYHNNLYILVVVEYVAKWVEVNVTLSNDSKVEIKSIKKSQVQRMGIVEIRDGSPIRTRKIRPEPAPFLAGMGIKIRKKMGMGRVW